MRKLVRCQAEGWAMRSARLKGEGGGSGREVRAFCATFCSRFFLTEVTVYGDSTIKV